MDERTQIIVDTFADWAVECRRQYVENYENEDDKRHIEELRRAAKNTYFHARKTMPYGWHGEAKKGFEQAAYEYFLYGLYISDSFYPIYRDRIERFNEKWRDVEQFLNESKSPKEAFDSISDMSDAGYRLINRLREDHPYLDEILDLKDIKNTLAEEKKIEHEERFGEKAVFERAGRYLSETIFRQMTKPKGRPSLKSNLDTLRAYQFGDIIVGKINKSLADTGHQKSTVAEVCELTFGHSKKLGSHPFASDVEWVLKEYFRVKNSTVKAFLNSVSRGKSRLSEDFFDEL